MKRVYCPLCGKELIRLEPYETGIYNFWCDDCDIDISITKNDEVNADNPEEFASDIIGRPDMDQAPIEIVFRDINGKRSRQIWQSVVEFQNFDWGEYNDETHEIILVKWGPYCIYNALSNDRINLQNLVGYFA